MKGFTRKQKPFALPATTASQCLSITIPDFWILSIFGIQDNMGQICGYLVSAKANKYCYFIDLFFESETKTGQFAV